MLSENLFSTNATLSAESITRSHRLALLWCLLYAVAWSLVSYHLDPTVPYDAIEALNWASNGEWGSPNNPWFVGFVARILSFSDSSTFASAFWYVGHFAVISLGMLGCYFLAHKLTDSPAMAWLALFTLNLSGVINFDAIPYNDNYLLFGSWPWLLFFFVKATYDDPKWWMPFGIIAGCASMAKYTTFAPVGVVFLLSLLVPQVRQNYQNRYFYIAILMFLALILPNFIWLVENNFSAFKWVSGQVSAQISPGSWLAVLSVFYPLILVAAMLGRKGLKRREDVPQKVHLTALVLLLPLVPIMAWFSFHKGERLVEWLHPFFMPAPAVLVGYLSHSVVPYIKRPLKILLVMAMVILVGYSSVLAFNVRNAGQKFVGIKTLSQDAEAFWQETTDKPLKLVGGHYRAQWFTFYIGTHPQLTNQWNNETLPNVYNRHINEAMIREYGALILGDLGKGCQPGVFDSFSNEWPQFALTEQKQIVFQESPQDPKMDACLGIVLPK